MIKPIKLADMPKRELIKPRPILANMMPGHWRTYKDGHRVFVNGFFRKPRSKRL